MSCAPSLTERRSERSDPVCGCRDNIVLCQTWVAGPGEGAVLSRASIVGREPLTWRWPLLDAARFLSAYCILPNLLFLALGEWLYLMRPTFNLDYLLVGALDGWLSRRGKTVVYCAVFANDLVINAAPAFHFDLPDFLRSLRHLGALQTSAVTLGVASLILLSGAVAAVAIRLGGVGQHGRLALVATIGLAGLDVANGTSFLPVPSSRSFVGFNVANSGVRRTLLALGRLTQPTAHVATPLPSADSAAGALLAAARDPSQRLSDHHQVLVVVESWGLFRDPDAAELLLRPLTALKPSYEVTVGTVPFAGATLDGEMRELCGERLAGGTPDPRDCLPAALARRGYSTTALHGFTREFYDRFAWYPKAGFQRSLFAEDLRAQGLQSSCGSGFRGLCDREVASRLEAELRDGGPGPHFVYWMTLNSHLPEVEEVGAGAEFDCAGAAITRDDPSLCLHARALSVALGAVARVAGSRQLPATDFTLVGDHAPPFLTRREREAFDSASVPFVTLTFRGSTAATVTSR